MKEWLAICDLDGTLYDTGKANYAAYAFALQKQGIALELETFLARYNGRYYRHFLPEVLGARHTEALMEEVHDDKIAYYRENVASITENTALYAQLEALAPRFYLALVTTASRANVQAILQHFGRQNRFDLVLSHEDVPRPKPSPMGYEMAMAHFGIAPQHTVIYEDSPGGMQAALAACPNVYKTYVFLPEGWA